jgi:hypothetical protein
MSHCIARKYLYLWGIKALLVELAYREKIEDYESCKAIRDVILYHNEIVGHDLPTKIEYLTKKHTTI